MQGLGLGREGLRSMVQIYREEESMVYWNQVRHNTQHPIGTGCDSGSEAVSTQLSDLYQSKHIH